MPEFIGTLKPPRLSAAPSSPAGGQTYYDTGLLTLRWWNGSAWVTAADAGADATKVDKDSVVVAATRIVASKLLAGDAQPAFQINGDGKIQWGPGGATALDTNLYRAAGGLLQTDGALKTLGYVDVGGNINLFNANGLGTGTLFFTADTYLYRAAAGTLQTDGNLYSNKWVSANTSDANRIILGYVISGSGAGITFGSALDTALYRSAAGTLKTDGNFEIGIGANVSESRLYLNLNSIGVRVVIAGAADSAGAGYRVLKVAN